MAERKQHLQDVVGQRNLPTAAWRTQRARTPTSRATQVPIFQYKFSFILAFPRCLHPRGRCQFTRFCAVFELLVSFEIYIRSIDRQTVKVGITPTGVRHFDSSTRIIWTKTAHSFVDTTGLVLAILAKDVDLPTVMAHVFRSASAVVLS